MGKLFYKINKYPFEPQRSFDNNIYGSYEDCMSGCAFEQRNEQGIKVELSQTCTHRVVDRGILSHISNMSTHTTYSWNIKWQKCAHMGFNGFIFKK